MSSIIKVDTIQNQSGANIISESSNTITVGASGDTITVPSGATLGGAGTVDLSSATVTLNDSMKMTPAWLATLSSQQSIAHATVTTVQFNSELKDTNSAFNTSNYTFTVPIGEGGTYYIFGNLNLHDFGTLDTKRVICKIMNNANSIGTFGEHQAANDGSAGHRNNFNVIANLSAGDVIKITIYHNYGSSYNLLADQADNLFGGFKLIGV